MPRAPSHHPGRRPEGSRSSQEQGRWVEGALEALSVWRQACGTRRTQAFPCPRQSRLGPWSLLLKTCGLHPSEIYFSSWGGVRAPQNPPWGGRCGLGPPLALEAPGEVTVPRARALPHPGPPWPPRVLGGTGHHGPAQDPTWGLEHGPGCPPSLPGPWCLRTRRWDGGELSLWREVDSTGAPLL